MAGVVSLGLALVLGHAAMIAAPLILALSLIAFHAIAFLLVDFPRFWKAVDYPWVLTTLTVILVSLANISENGKLNPLLAAQNVRIAAIDDLIYAVESTITNDCHPKGTRAQMWSPSPEPTPGECERLEHFLPQMKVDRAKADKDPMTLFFNEWGMNIILDRSRAVGSWMGLYRQADKFTAVNRDYQRIHEEVRKRAESPLVSLSRGEAMKFWYFLLAYVLGLRIAKISAELLVLRVPKQ